MSSLIPATVLNIFKCSSQYLPFFSQYLQLPSLVTSSVFRTDFNSHQYFIPFSLIPSNVLNIFSCPQHLQLFSKYIEMSSSLSSCYLLSCFLCLKYLLTLFFVPSALLISIFKCLYGNFIWPPQLLHISSVTSTFIRSTFNFPPQCLNLFHNIFKYLLQYLQLSSLVSLNVLLNIFNPSPRKFQLSSLFSTVILSTFNCPH